MKDENGQTVLLGPGEIRKHWWRFISYIPQGSMSVLNPVVKIEIAVFRRDFAQAWSQKQARDA